MFGIAAGLLHRIGFLYQTIGSKQSDMIAVDGLDVVGLPVLYFKYHDPTAGIENDKIRVKVFLSAKGNFVPTVIIILQL